MSRIAGGVLVALVGLAVGAGGIQLWAHQALFGDIRLAHAGTDVVLGTVILGLLWLGTRAPAP